MGDRRATHRTRRGLLVVASVLLVAACTDDGDEPAASAEVAEGETVGSSEDDLFTQVSSTIGPMRSVPTVAPSTLPGQVDDASDGVIELSPTIAPPPPVVDPNDPAETVAPPTTDLVGDPQPAPGTTSPPPPATVEPPPEACIRLEEFGISPIVTAAGGPSADVTTISSTACRYVSGPVFVEVHFVPVQMVRLDWFQREGVEPVGEVSGDAVGLPVFTTPEGGSSGGYSVAVGEGVEGVVVAVTGTTDDRALAAEVAIFANQAV